MWAGICYFNLHNYWYKLFFLFRYTIYLQIYNLFMWFWLMNFIVALSHITLAGSFASYYWAFNKPGDIPHFPVSYSLYRALRWVWRGNREIYHTSLSATHCTEHSGQYGEEIGRYTTLPCQLLTVQALRWVWGGNREIYHTSLSATHCTEHSGEYGEEIGRYTTLPCQLLTVQSTQVSMERK